MISDEVEEMHFADEHTTLGSILHSTNGIPILRAQAEACCGAVVVLVDDLILEDFDVVGTLAVFRASVSGSRRFVRLIQFKRVHSLVTTIICP